MPEQLGLAVDAARPAAQASWHHRQMVSLDLETTHAAPEMARIVSGTAVLVGGGKPIDITSVLIDPGFDIPAEATGVHGITTERARAEGVSPTEGLAELLWVLTTMLTDASVPLIVFNARYDLTVIDREARRLGLVAELAKIRSFVVDPLVIDYHLDRYRPKTVASHKLVDVCRLYGATLDRAHDAASDAISAARLAWAITEKGHVVRRCRGDQERREALELRAEWDSVRYDLPLLHHAQKRWATERALNFAEYLETELGDAEALDRADAIRQIEARFWPVIPPAERRLAA